MAKITLMRSWGSTSQYYGLLLSDSDVFHGDIVEALISMVQKTYPDMGRAQRTGPRPAKVHHLIVTSPEDHLPTEFMFSHQVRYGVNVVLDVPTELAAYMLGAANGIYVWNHPVGIYQDGRTVTVTPEPSFDVGRKLDKGPERLVWVALTEALLSGMKKASYAPTLRGERRGPMPAPVPLTSPLAQIALGRMPPGEDFAGTEMPARLVAAINGVIQDGIPGLGPTLL